MDEGPGIVWLVDGRELPFDDEGEPPRTWLEESSAWGARDDAPAGDDDGDDEGEPPRLIWV
ncbi:hypothetical protein [Thermophilibacter sp.]